QQICDVICDTTTHTWLGSVPKNFGEASTGMIKADEWQSLITIYLPIALMSLPAHLWWCFSFERLIGIIQCLPVNHKFGELENTMLLSYVKSARLRCWLTETNHSPAIQECGALFDQ
ncbi:hypothetical protein BDR04DRAFT_988305, partial [Suillus decipiens]